MESSCTETFKKMHQHGVEFGSTYGTFNSRKYYELNNRTADGFPITVTKSDPQNRQRNALKANSQEGVINPSISNLESYGTID